MGLMSNKLLTTLSGRLTKETFGRLLLCCVLLCSYSDTSWASWTTKYDAPIQSAVDKWWLDIPEWRLWKAQLIAESNLNPNAVSPVGAEGLAQFMPKTWTDTIRALSWPQTVSRRDAAYAIEGGAWYMRKLRAQWKTHRPVLEKHWLSTAAYNRGTGNILKDQKECGDALLWNQIRECTALHTMETVNYVARIQKTWAALAVE